MRSPLHEDNRSGTIVGNEFRNKLSVLLSWLLALLVASCCGIWRLSHSLSLFGQPGLSLMGREGCLYRSLFRFAAYFKGTIARTTKTIRPMARVAAATTATSASTTCDKKTEPLIFRSGHPNHWPRSTPTSRRRRWRHLEPCRRFSTFRIPLCSGPNATERRPPFGRWLRLLRRSRRRRPESRRRTRPRLTFPTGGSARTTTRSTDSLATPSTVAFLRRWLKWVSEKTTDLPWWQSPPLFLLQPRLPRRPPTTTEIWQFRLRLSRPIGRRVVDPGSRASREHRRRALATAKARLPPTLARTGSRGSRQSATTARGCSPTSSTWSRWVNRPFWDTKFKSLCIPHTNPENSSFLIGQKAPSKQPNFCTTWVLKLL